MKLEYFGLSDSGIKLDHNEDYYLIESSEDKELRHRKGQIFAIADGMGGNLDGEFASKKATDVFVESYYESYGDTESEIIEAVRKANQAVYTVDAETNFTAAVFVKNRCHAVHVGNSRLYLLRGRKLKQITIDYSKNLEEENYTAKNVLIHSLGKEDKVEPELYKIKLHKNDRFLLTTDGVHSVLDEENIYEILKYNEPQVACYRLIERAKANGSKDNLTCIVIQVIKKDSLFRIILDIGKELSNV